MYPATTAQTPMRDSGRGQQRDREASMRATSPMMYGRAGAAFDATPDEPEADLSQLGSVRISRRVLRTVVEQAALSVPGVAHMASVANRWPQALSRPLPRHGVGLIVRDGNVTIDLYLVARIGYNMVEVGSRAQEAVGAAIEHILGMGVSAINVYIQDVA